MPLFLWRGTDKVRIIVLSQIPREEHNSIWYLISADPEAVRFGAEHLHPNTSDTRRMMLQLIKVYQLEGLPMPYTMEQFRKEFDSQYLERMPIEERLRGVSLDELLRVLSREEKLAELSDDDLRTLRENIDRIASTRRATDEESGGKDLPV